MDLIDAFDKRIESIQSARARGSTLATSIEVDAAVATYERVKTAKAICEALLPKATAAEIVSLALEIGAEARHRHKSSEVE